jgi:glycogen(starch) synthase
MTGVPRTILMTADAVGGVWTYALELCRALGHHDAHVILATMGPLPDASQRRDAHALRNITLREGPYQLEWMDDPWDDVARAGEWLLGLDEQYRPNVIHLNGYAHAAPNWSAPTLVVAHSCVLSWWQAVKGHVAPPCYARYRAAVARGLCAAGAIVAPTTAMAHALTEHYGTIPPVRVIPNARDRRLFRPLDKESFVFSAGRLWDEAKNLAAIDAVAPQLPWPVYVAGDGGEQASPRSARRLGRLPTGELADWLGRASIYALPARYEPFGLSVLEAAMAGCALVLGDIPSLRENWTGAATFVPPDDRAALAAAVNRLIENPDRRDALALLARDRAQSFSPARMADDYLRTYGDLIQISHPGHDTDVRPGHDDVVEPARAFEPR